MNSFLEEKWSLVGLGFNPWEYSRAEKQGILLAIFKALNVLTVLELSPSDMLEFCLDMESLYEDVPYHSFNHAIDVVAKLYYMLHDLQAASYLASYDIAALLISGLCHDCGHPGLNNLFQKNANTSFAQKYPDAILERYSIDLAMEYIARHRLFRNVENLRDPVYSDSTTTEIDVSSRMQFSIKCAILNTDMARHFDVVEECKTLVSKLAKKARKFADKSAGTSTANESSGSSLAQPISSNSNGHEQLRPSIPQIRERSPSEPVMHRNVLSAYSLRDASRGAATSPQATPKDIPDTPTNPIQPQPTADGSNCSVDSSAAVQGRIKRMHVRRSVSMSDALLDSTQRQSLINILLHAVDVFNPVLPWPMCKKWSDLMNTESFNQGDLEKQLSLPLSPNMDRETTDQRQVSLDFGNIIIRPFFTEMVPLFPVDDVLLPTLESNLQKWSRLSTDTTHEISSPTGANSHMYSWPVEPVRTTPSLSSNSSISEGRRLSIAAGTVDIPPSRLETIRRHSHEGFEALHRCMVGHLFSKHLEKIQERRKASYISSNPQHLQMRNYNGRQRPVPITTSSGTQHLWQDSGATMLSPVTEAAYLEDSSAPTTGNSTNGGFSLPNEPIITEYEAGDTVQQPSLLHPGIHISTDYSHQQRYPLTSRGPASASWETARADRARAGIPSVFYRQLDSQGLAEHLHSYCISPPPPNPRQYRSASLDPSLLSNLPTTFKSVAGEGSLTAMSPKLSNDS
ncbi:hypothetical protein GGH96_003727 [Coemansia sp. RSA 1972]|nr:hypothetical protein GGH96_003727 [Coemansia sp. RSA 1972]